MPNIPRTWQPWALWPTSRRPLKWSVFVCSSTVSRLWPRRHEGRFAFQPRGTASSDSDVWSLAPTTVDGWGWVGEGELKPFVRLTCLFLDVLEGGGRYHRKANQKDVRLRVTQWPETVVILLTGGVKQAQSVWLAADHYCDRVVVKNLRRQVISKKRSFISTSLTVGTYSDGNLLVVYDIRRHVFPTAPSPTTTHLMVCMINQLLVATTNRM